MGEQKRRMRNIFHNPVLPENSKVALQVKMYSPTMESFSEPTYRMVLNQWLQKANSGRNTPMCGTCDYEFKAGDFPSLIYIVSPFISTADKYEIISGAICDNCQENKSMDKLFLDLYSYLRKGMIPGLEEVGELSSVQ